MPTPGCKSSCTSISTQTKRLKPNLTNSIKLLLKRRRKFKFWSKESWSSNWNSRWGRRIQARRSEGSEKGSNFCRNSSRNSNRRKLRNLTDYQLSWLKKKIISRISRRTFRPLATNLRCSALMKRLWTSNCKTSRRSWQITNQLTKTSFSSSPASWTQPNSS